MRWTNRPAFRTIAVCGLIVGILAQLLPLPASAAALSNVYVRLDRMKINTTTGALVCAKPSAAGAGTEAKLKITFPSSYTLDGTAAHWTLNTTNIPAGSTAWPNIGSATITPNNSTKELLINTTTSGDLGSASLYCFNFVGDGTNPLPLTTASSAVVGGEVTTVETFTSADVLIDRSYIALTNISDDQIVVTAVVPPSFQFSLSGNADTFTTTLNSSAVHHTTGITGTVTTNAKGGWIAWAKNLDRSGGAAPNNVQGLYSATANTTIATTGTVNGAVSTLSAGTEGYLLDVDTTDAANGCTAATTAEYNGTTAAEGGTFSNIFQPISQCTGVDGNGRGTANGDTFVLIEKVAIAAFTPAGSDYTDVITVVAAGNF